MHNANETRKQVAALQDKIKNMSLKDSVANIPYLRGANNSVAKGKSQPYIIGEHLFTPIFTKRRNPKTATGVFNSQKTKED